MTITLGRFTFEIGCPHEDADDRRPGPDGDLACGDCLREWRGQPDYRFYDFND
jgi:hypothetical protein